MYFFKQSGPEIKVKVGSGSAKNNVGSTTLDKTYAKRGKLKAKRVREKKYLRVV
jgi:hypothetical protein